MRDPAKANRIQSAHPPVAVANGWAKTGNQGLGRKDSNPRMPESKSGALTNLATPQRMPSKTLDQPGPADIRNVDIAELWRIPISPVPGGRGRRRRDAASFTTLSQPRE